MSAKDERKKPVEEGDEEGNQQAPAKPRRPRERAIYIDAATGEELYRDDGEEEEFDEEMGEYDEEMPDLEAQEDEEDEEDEEIDPTPVDLAWATFGVHEDSVFTTQMFVGADGKILLASGGGDDAAFLLDVGNGEVVPEGGEFFKFEGHSDSVAEVSFSADGKYLATAGLDAIIKIWNVSDGTLLHTLDGPSESIESVQWHSKGPVILAGCGDGTTWMWDASPKAGTSLNVFGGHAGAVNAAKFTPDGSKVVTIGEDGSLRVWGPKTGKSLAVISGHPFHEAGINCLQISLDSTMALTGGQDNVACISNLVTGKVKLTLKGHDDGVEDVAWVQGNPWAVTGSLDSKIGIWDLNTGNNRQMIENGAAGITSVQCIGNTIFTSDTAGYIRLWDVRSSNLIQTIRASSETILAFDVLADKKLIATAGDDTLIKLYQIQS